MKSSLQFRYRARRRLLAAGTAALLCVYVAAMRAVPALAAEAAAPDAAPFIAGFADLPLMPGLAEIPDDGVAFDTPSGRIVESYAKGIVAADAVRDFYARTLPQLGWRQASQDHFEREGESLDVETAPDPGPPGGAVTVHFYLAPKAAPRPASR